MKAIWKDTVLAESNKTIVIEENNYFPPNSVKMEYLKASGEIYQCPWKGKADYFTVEVGGETISKGAWIYKEPMEAAKEIKGYIAFDNSIKVTG